MWYSTGTISVSTDGTVATGSGTSWLSNVRVGDGLTISGSSSIHEVTNISSDTAITFKPAYTGATGSGKAYSIAPVQGYVKDLADQAKQLIQSIGANATKLANMPTSINGKTFDGTAAITTPSWGEARNLTIGSATKSVNGETNIGFTLTEIGLGTAATSDVATIAQALAGTAGVLPDAAGVHAAFGQYGLGSKGSELGNNFDLNSEAAFIDGSWRVQNTPVNGPPWDAGFCQLRVTRGTGDTVNQTIYSYYDNRISFRSGVTAVGDSHDVRNKSWLDLFHTGNILGTVSQSGGVPTGAIIERGSNANGEYVRFADGTQICFGNSSMVTDTAYGTTGLYYTQTPPLTTLPASFANPYYQVATAGAAAINVLPGGATPVSGSTFRTTGMYPANAAPISVHWIAIGRWY